MLGDRGEMKKYRMMINPHTGRIIGCQFGDEELIWCGECIFNGNCISGSSPERRDDKRG